MALQQEVIGRVPVEVIVDITGGDLPPQLVLTRGWTGLENCGNFLNKTVNVGFTGSNLYGYISQAIGFTSLQTIGGLQNYSNSVNISDNEVTMSFGLSGNQQISGVSEITVNYQQGPQGIVLIWNAGALKYSVIDASVTSFVSGFNGQQFLFDIIDTVALNVHTVHANKPITFVNHDGISFVKNPINVYNLIGTDRIDLPYVPSPSLIGKLSLRTRVNSNPSPIKVFFSDGNNFYIIVDSGGSVTTRCFGSSQLVHSVGLTLGVEFDISLEWIPDGLGGVDWLTTINGVSEGGNQSNVILAEDIFFGNNAGQSLPYDGYIRDIEKSVNNIVQNFWSINEGSGTAVTDSIGSLDGVIINGIGSWGLVGDEIATGPTTTTETSPITQLTYEDVSWIVDPVLGDIVALDYDPALGNYQDDDGNPMSSQVLNLTNCITPPPPRSISQTYYGPRNIGSGTIFDSLYNSGIGSGVSNGNEVLLDQFLYNIDRGDLWGSNTVNPFVVDGPWTAAKAINVSGSSLGYIYTVPPSFIENMTDTLPGIDSSRCLCVESIPGAGQTDFWLRTGSPIDEGGAVDTLPADIWIQFWMYQQNSGSQTGIVQSDKLIYPTKTNQTRPAEEMWLVDLRNQNFGWLGSGHQWYVAPNLNSPSMAYFQIEHGSSANTNFINWAGAGGDSWWKMQHHDASPPTPMIQNKWTLVRVHFDESGISVPGGIGNISVRQYGQQNFTQPIDLVHGQNIDGSLFNWNLPNNNGAAAISFFTTLTSNTFTFYKDMAIARGVNSGGGGVNDLPIYTGY